MGYLVETMAANNSFDPGSGREASRHRRARLSLGKGALPAAAERTRTGERSAAVLALNDAAPRPVSYTTTAKVEIPKATGAAGKAQVAVMPAAAGSGQALTGRDASRARRSGLVQGKSGLRQATAPALMPATAPAAPMAAPDSPAFAAPVENRARMAAQAMRAMRARNGRGDTASARPSGRVRNAQPIQYPAKVAATETYAGGKVTGVRIGRGMNVTGDERGAAVQVTGSQYIGKETGFLPREGGVKVGAQRTASGLIVTGTQVRSQVPITGDESNTSIRITGEADQELGDDALSRRESSASADMQFQRQHNPHGHTVFGTNLGRSARAIGSRSRDTTRALEQTHSGLPISGTAVGRSLHVTGDEEGACRSITGDQYLTPASQQAACGVEHKPRARAGMAMAMNGRPDPVTGEKVVVSESWSRNRITGVDVEHNANVSGDEYGVCSLITGTPYVGPGQYESFCDTGDAGDAARVATPGLSAGKRVTGDTPRNVGHVTGTQRGGERAITGTPYFRADVEADMKTNIIEHVNKSFSVRSPQREGQMRADAAAIEAPSAVARITGTFTAGQGKITGNQEFHFSPRVQPGTAASTRLTGEGRAQGTAITGSAWIETRTVTGTEGYIAAERNPSERAGRPQAFAGSRTFKDKSRSDEPRKLVTGIVGWSDKTGARITLSGGAHGH